MCRTCTLVIVASACVLAWAPDSHAKHSVTSVWQDQQEPISIDGSADEWEGQTTYIDAVGLHVSVRNDAEYLYLCLYSSNARVGGRTLLLGLNVALGDELTIKFPTGVMGQGGPSRGRVDREQMRERASDSLDTIVVVHEDRLDPQHLSADNSLGIAASIVTDPEFTYELRIPLEQSERFPYAIGATPGEKIRIRVSTPKMERPEAGRRPGSGGGMGGGRGGGFGGGMGGRGGGSGGGMRKGRPGGSGEQQPPRPEPLQFKMKVQLAAEPD